MAEIWFEHRGSWTVHSLRGARVALGELFGAAANGITLVRCLLGGKERWAVVMSPRTIMNINGINMPMLGMHIVNDKDRAKLVGASFFFSSEKLARVETRSANAGAAVCARCRGPIAPSAEIVACPACGSLHHETQTLPCFSYAETCAVCLGPTALDGAYRFFPGDL
jgi:hypothetical protein